MNNFQRYSQMALDWAVLFVPKVLLALVIFWVGFRIIHRLNAITNKMLVARKVDDTVRPFFSSLVDVALKFVLFLIVASIFGFEITSILALLSAVAFAVGLALQGSLGHFASGILLLILKPYKVGDEIKVGDVEGFVQEIQVFNTILRTRDNRKIIVPNGVITSGNIANLTDQPQRRLDMTFIVDEPNKIQTVKNVIFEALATCSDILAEPAPEVFLESFNCDELHFAVRPWCKTENYWKVWGEVQEAIKDGFDRAELTGNVHYIKMVNDRSELKG